MIKDMYFVYSLSCDNSVFYVGMTGNLAQRYKSHLIAHRYKQASPAALYIGELLSANKQIKLTIIEHLPRKEAEIREREIIYLFSRAGHKIYNEQHTAFRYYDSKWPTSPHKRDILNHIKYLQYTFEDTYCCLNNIDYEQATGTQRISSSERFR